MTRKKEIDKEKVLDAAESLILESGGRLFTLDAVAERAGIAIVLGANFLADGLRERFDPTRRTRA